MKLNDFVAIAKKAMDEMRSQNFEIDLMDCEFIYKRVIADWGMQILIDCALFIKRKDKTITALRINLNTHEIELAQYDIYSYQSTTDLIWNIARDSGFDEIAIRNLFYSLK